MSDRNGNDNCLEGLECPKCHQSEDLSIVAHVGVRVTDGGAEPERDWEWEWNKDSFTRCPVCNYHERLREFEIVPASPAPAG
jgi:hypothetical protein